MQILCPKTDNHELEINGTHCPQCGERLIPVLQKGDNIAGYRIIKRLSGNNAGMAIVYKARKGFETVALKIAKPEFARELREEARLLQNLDHPNIIPILPLIQAEDEAETQYSRIVKVQASEDREFEQPFIALKYINGVSLYEWRSGRKRVSILNIIEITLQICEALYYLHHIGKGAILHKDIKLSNVLINKRGHIYLIDFGIATSLLQSLTLGSQSGKGTKTFARIGASPELLDDEYLDDRHDIFQIGVLMYILLVNRPPYGKTVAEIRKAFRKGPAQSACDQNSDIPVGISKIIDKAIVPDKVIRYQKIGDFMRDLNIEREELIKAKSRLHTVGTPFLILLFLAGVVALCAIMTIIIAKVIL